MAEIRAEQAEQLFANIAKSIQREMPKILMNAANVGSAEMQFRIFNQGRSADGAVMNYKNAQYKKLRENNGLQVRVKDLIFEGNLFNSLDILSHSNTEVSYGFTNADSAQIAEYQETSPIQVNKPIFSLNTKESKIIDRSVNADVERIVVRSVESFPALATLAPLSGNNAAKSGKTASKARKSFVKKPKLSLAKKRLNKKARAKKKSK